MYSGSGKAVGRCLEERGMIPRSGILVIQAGWGFPKRRILIQAQMIHERNKKISSCYLTVLLRGLAVAGGTQAGRLSLG